MKTKSTTLYDVAQHAGVSYQTVSRVINQADNVAEKTRLKVEAAMAALNYVPNRVAQQLAGKMGHTIGLATADLSLHAPSQIAAAIKSRAGQMRFNVVISMTEQSGLDAARAAINSLLAQRVDGLVVNIPLQDDEAQSLAALCQDVPVLFLDVSPQLAANSVIFDPTQGAQLGVAHLLSLGHRDIALLAGPQSSVSARLRFEGWQAALAQQQLQATAVMEGDWSALSGYQQVTRLLNEGAQPGAILVANDQMALGALRALAEAGLQVPGEVSVIGYDDTADSACFIPPLTTIKQDFRALGNNSVERLIAMIRQPDAPIRSDLLPVSLVIRKTTAPPYQGALSPQALSEALMRLARQAARLK
ncbi:LacI family DNA-binding transcriptional regulator [Mixta tenebrionis]|uniref:Substrate-binding domain-containing protein n=1 Tax=Mixta tenebrionis TaxID=2562439 RepID=A0A506UXC4_9GAMM|nr:LacI family DNA-binding transcriptional regulator [Mixta tenebrionis]TPW38019.1 substrate-binding domain-containing protein [Mixta tenebrionis]